MSETTKMVTEREAWERERVAVRRTVAEMWPHVRIAANYHSDWRGAGALAEKLYPTPKVTRSRVARDPHRPDSLRWMVGGGGGILGASVTENGWGCWRPVMENPTPERVALWADLLANPTEEVEDTGATDTERAA